MPRGRILLLVENQPVPFDRRVWSQARTLQGAGYTVTIISPTAADLQPGYELREGIHIYRYDPGPAGNGFLGYAREYAVATLKTAWISLRALRRPGFDVIHTANPPDLFFLIALVYKLLGKKFVFDQHDLAPELYRAQRAGREGPVYRTLLLLERLSYAAADLVIATNESIAGIARSRGHVPPERTVVVRNGPDPARFKSVPAQQALKRGAKHMVCYVGVMGIQDGLEYALRAAAWVIHVKGRRDVHFTFIGDGSSLPGLKRLTVDLRLDEHVTFTGQIDDDETLLSYLSTADLCVTPDPQNGLNEFSTMIKTLEYMAVGKAQVAFDLDETRFSAQGAALYARPNDVEDFGAKVLELLDRPLQREAMGQIGLYRIQSELSSAHTQVHLLDAYARLFVPERTGVVAGQIPAAQVVATERE